MHEFEFMGPIVAIVAIIFAFGSPILLVACILVYKQRKLRLTHETVLKLAEKGVPIPSELLTGPVETRTDLRRGLVLFFVGLALAIFLLEVSAPWSIGLIPMFAGLGYLISWKLEGKNAGTPQAKAAQPL